VQRGDQAGEGRLSLAPAPDAFGARDWPGDKRFIVQEPVEFVRDFLSGPVPAMRLLLETFEANCFKISMHARIKPAGRNWIGLT
jgi:hypothetical protein